MTKLDLQYYPREWQRECHMKRKRFTVLALHRRAGKTELAIMELIDKAARFDKELGLYFYIAPFLKQAKAIAWARLKQKIEPLRVANAVEVNESELSIRFKHNGALIRVYGADNPDAMRGVRLDGVVIDEVAQTKPEVWTEIIQPALSDRKGWAFFIGTPNGINLFSELFFKAKSLPDWFSARYTVNDTHSLDVEEVARLKRDMTENSFSREYLCDFSASGDDQLISLSDVEGATQRNYDVSKYGWSPRILGVDPARFGDDKSVIFPRQGLRAGTPLVFNDIDNMDLAARVAEKAREWNADAIFVDAGNGSGVIDRLRQLNVDCIEVWFGGKPIAERYKNKRTEMWCEMADWIRMGGSIPNDVNLKQDLAAPTYDYDMQGRRQLEPKDKIKARGLPSPDMGDALALTFAMPVVAKTDKEMFLERHGRARDTREYDPMEML